MDLFDIMIIGGGMAGTSAALTAINREKSVAVISNPVETTSLCKAELITNYPGAAGTGRELALALDRQLSQSGAEVIRGRALSVMPLGDSFAAAVGNDFYRSRAVILAVGITREKLYPGESEFLGRGVSYCATCDGMLYRGKRVALIGDNSEADADEDFLRSIGCSVLRFRGAHGYEIHGKMKAETLLHAGEEYAIDCVFIMKDTVSVTKLIPGLSYENGAIVTEKGLAAAGVPGVFVAGDCAGRPYQLAKAAGEGNMAALSACEYIDNSKKRE